MENVRPRLSAAQLSTNRGQLVTIVGRIVESTSGKAILQAHDKGIVNIKTIQDQNFQQGFVEVVGRVMDDLTVEELNSINLGDNFDIDLYADVIEISKKYPSLMGL
ncbi:hypothetical protein G9A89_005860 [Geosiphon pyriformis]|nr:hypothetical protein G9A89_005860 [Geosiphon pyriformis]